MKTAYISSIDVDGNSAASNQVRCMCRAFHKNLGTKFIALLMTANHSKVPYVVGNKSKLKGRLKKLWIPISFIRFVLKDEIQQVYCREIFVALCYTLLGRKVIFELHELNGSFTQEALIWLLSFFHNFSIITVSKAGKLKICEKFSRIKCNVLPNGVFLDDYAELHESRMTIRADVFRNTVQKLNFTYTGSLYKGKDAEIIFDLANQDKDIQFWVIGGSKLEFSALKSKYGKLENVNHIETLPNSEVKKYQVGSDALIYPISKENKINQFTSPLKIFEYMASKRPIVANAIGSVSELLSSDKCYLFSLNPLSMKEILIKLKRDLETGEYMEVSNLAYKFVQKNFTWESRVQKVLDIFNDK